MADSRGSTGASVCYTWTTGDRLVVFMDEADSVISCDKIRNAERHFFCHVIADHVYYLGYHFRLPGATFGFSKQ